MNFLIFSLENQKWFINLFRFFLLSFLFGKVLSNFISNIKIAIFDSRSIKLLKKCQIKMPGFNQFNCPAFFSFY